MSKKKQVLPPELSEKIQKVIKLLQEKGTLSRDDIVREFRLSDEEYALCRNEFARQKLAVPLRGRGGGLRLPPLEEETLPTLNESALEQAKRQERVAGSKFLAEKGEGDLYPYVKRWAEENGYAQVRIVANMHRRPQWENPDLIAVSAFTPRWFVGQQLEVTTFEVKLEFDIFGIWQAAHYRHFSHYVFLACYTSQQALHEPDEGRLFDIAVDLGLGIIAMTSAGAGGKGVKCDVINQPARQTPLIEELDRLLDNYHDIFDIKSAGTTIIEQMGNVKLDVSS
jgi:hypothetical protein